MSDIMKMGRALTAGETGRLQAQGCMAEDWSRLRVAADFTPDYIIGVLFSGFNYLGRFDRTFESDGGVPKYAGIFHAQLHNCIVHDQVQIRNVNRVLANYEIGAGSRIENVDVLYCEGVSTFGNGCRVAVLDETGGKAVAVYEGLSSHTAFLCCVFSHKKALTEAVATLADRYADSVRSDRGRIGAGCIIRDAGVIRNVRMGDGCVIEGAARLEEGSLCSAPAADGLAVSKMGTGVIARHFILAPDAQVTDASQVEHCFVGEAVVLSKGFSAHDSLFFANTQMENGEACASFAGPYSVSMHKSTLMVGGMFSFCNFGSGTNQSNHFYKLGPMHSGVLERGCKTGSDAYILWPGRVGAFTFVKGRHLSNPVTTDFPFSYLLEENGTGYLLPGAAFRSVGTLRDERKWPARDRRKALNPADKLCFDALNPYTVAAIRRGLNAMEQWAAQPEQTEFLLSGAVVRKSALVKGRKLYLAAVDCFRGAVLLQRLEALLAKADQKAEQLPEQSGKVVLTEQAVSGLLFTEKLIKIAAETQIDSNWADVAGLLVPELLLNQWLEKLEQGEIVSVEELEAAWAVFYDAYSENCWSFVLADLSKELDKPVSSLTTGDLMSLLNRWETAQAGLYRQMQSDADLELSMMQRFQGGDKPGHDFLKVIQALLDEVPVRAERARSQLNG